MMDDIVKTLQKRGYGTTSLYNLQEKIEDILTANEVQELKLNSIRDITGNRCGKIETLRISVFEAIENYDLHRQVAEMILKIDGMEEAIVDELESMGFDISSSS